jgi:hypothetical protein
VSVRNRASILYDEVNDLITEAGNRLGHIASKKSPLGMGIDVGAA